MAKKSDDQKLRKGYPWIYAPDGQWVPGAMANTSTSISGMNRKYLMSCLEMVKRDVGFINEERCKDVEALSEFRIRAADKIKELEAALKTQKT